ncbi:MAG TPA: hypothetical protein VL485_05770, partial [Ktedonobacteraceae bacterium]|nr:hypothetical protein [Ktedonobacteraceae bacterium]
SPDASSPDASSPDASSPDASSPMHLRRCVFADASSPMHLRPMHRRGSSAPGVDCRKPALAWETQTNIAETLQKSHRLPNIVK